MGCKVGDRVIVYMPMVPEALVAMLACARIGAVHSVVFGGFAANELATRIDDAKPVLILSASCGVEGAQGDPLQAAARPRDRARPRTSPGTRSSCSGPQGQAELIAGRDLDWADAMTAHPVDCVPVEATDPLYILYTSGTTGQPKGVVRDHGGHATALLWTMRNIYGVAARRGVLGRLGRGLGRRPQLHLLRAPAQRQHHHRLRGQARRHARPRRLLARGQPSTRCRCCSPHPPPSAPSRRRIRKARYIARYDLSSLRTLFLAGERCDPDTLLWAEAQLGVPVIDHWWQTETGWAIAANPIGIEQLPVRPGSPTVPMPGYDVQILDEQGEVLGPGKMGAICIRLPMPPGCLPTLWHADARYRQAYLSRYPGWYLTGDAGYKDADGYLYIMSRIDDVINVAGHRLSTGGMEEVLASHQDVAECAVIGVADQLKGELPLGLVVLKAGVDRDPETIRQELMARVRDQIGPVAAFKLVAVVSRLPKTRSGKILRGTMKKLADNTEYKVPATIDDPVILDEIAESLKELGYAREQS